MKIIIADDHEAYRAGLAHITQSAFEGCKIIEADSYQAVAGLAAEHGDASLCLSDLFMPGLDDGFDLADFCKMLAPIPVVMVSGSENYGHIRKAMASGAQGYILKTMSNEQITLALKLVLSGEKYVPAIIITENPPSAVVAKELIAQLPTRQMEVFAAIMRGASNKDIAIALDISLSTVKNHIALIMRRLDVANRHEMISKYSEDWAHFFDQHGNFNSPSHAGVIK